MHDKSTKTPIEQQIREKVGQVIEKCQREKPDDEKLAEAVVWIGLALRWLALPNVSARKDPEPA